MNNAIVNMGAIRRRIGMSKPTDMGKEKNRLDSFILNEAIQEECNIVTGNGTRQGLVLLDADKYYLMFRDLSCPGIVLVRREDVKSLEFSESESVD